MIRLALGTVQFGSNYGVANQIGQVEDLEVKSILKIASANGIKVLDTAMSYGDSEVRLGWTGLGDFKIVTKLTGLPDGCADVGNWVQKEMDSSLQRLGVKSVYGLLLHRPEQLLGPNKIALYKALETLRERGQIQKIGISIYSPTELEGLLPSYKFDLVQAPLNLLDRRLLTSGWMQRMKDCGMEIHTRSSFLQGLLLMRRDQIPDYFSPWSSLWTKWHAWLADSRVSAVEACLGFPLSFSEIDQVLVGVDSSAQLREILSVSNADLPTNLPDIECRDEALINPSNWILP